MTSDPQLKRWYTAFRKKYFSNSLPAPSEVQLFYDSMPGLHGECEDEIAADREDYTIRINRAWEAFPDFAKLILLHEMAHLHLWPYESHGKRFQQEMLRLAGLGALKGLW